MSNLFELYLDTDPNATYTLYDCQGQYGLAKTGSDLPDNSVVVFTDISGETIQDDAKNEIKDLHNMGSQGRQDAQEQEEQMEEQYYSYLTGGSSGASNLCMA